MNAIELMLELAACNRRRAASRMVASRSPFRDDERGTPDDYEQEMVGVNYALQAESKVSRA